VRVSRALDVPTPNPRRRRPSVARGDGDGDGDDATIAHAVVAIVHDAVRARRPRLTRARGMDEDREGRRRPRDATRVCGNSLRVVFLAIARGLRV